MGGESGVLIGHSMGGRTAMQVALREPHKVTDLVVVDVSPVNVDNVPRIKGMSALFDALEEVHFLDGVPLSQARMDAEMQLAASGVESPVIRNWLLMNIVEVDDGIFDWCVNVSEIRDALDDYLGNFIDASPAVMC